ncbi:MAG: Fic family protein [Firmicutes bacterium]|nr:Fic family protein [Bacillota bacterium]
MRTFDYSFLKKENIPSSIVGILLAIEKINAGGDLLRQAYPNVFMNLEDIARVQSVKASNAIEGIVSTDKRIEEIVHQKTEPINHDEKEIAGYRDVLNRIHLHAMDDQFRETTIFDYHRMMLAPAGLPFRGQYKETDNVIMQVNAQGERSIRFQPLSARETPKGMEQLVLAYLEGSQDSEINRLLLIPSVILDFLCIHPFIDGNGRMSRLLSLFLLYQSHYGIGKYISFEQQINLHKGEYYESLRVSSLNWLSGKNDYYPFIEYFLTTLLSCYEELDRRFSVMKGKKLNKKRRVEETIYQSISPISKEQIHALFPDISIETIQKTLAALLKEEKIVKIGTFRDAKYLKKENKH